jgi:uncharacterized protein (TIGR03000 family)
MAVAIVLLTAESVFAQRLLDRIRARRENRQNNYVESVQPVVQQQTAQVQPGQQQQQQLVPVTTTTYERRGLFGRRSVPVTSTSWVPANQAPNGQAQPAVATEVVTTYERRGLFGRRVVPVQTVAFAQPQPQGQPVAGQGQPVQNENRQIVGQPGSTTVSQGTVTYYERRGLFGRRRVPVQAAVSTNGQTPIQPASRRAFYLEPGSASVLLNVRVPANNAEILVDGQRTTQTGTQRQFISPPLAPGFEYTYTVEARWQENGQQMNKTRKVSVQPGREVVVDFSQPDPQP